MEEGHMLGKYSKGAIVLHWLIGGLIIANIAFAMLPLPKPVHEFLMGLHLSFGIIILFLAFLRIIWRLTHKPPAKPADLSGWEMLLSRVVHFLFYALMLLVPLSGWIWMTAEGYPVDMFGLFTMPNLPVEKSKELADAMHDRHELLGLITLGLVVLHIIGALKHQFADRLPFIQRMWP
jgi:cytochrome b561